MNSYITPRATRYLPQVVVATAVVAIIPIAAAWWLRTEGWISSPLVSALLAMALSLAAWIGGAAYWKRRRQPGDLFFSELLLWGWLRRVRTERQLADSVGVLGLERADAQVGRDVDDVERKAQLLRQLAAALDAQDPYTDGHSRRVALHSAMVARKLGLSGEEVEQVRTAAAVHDIGKLHVPPEVLNKPGKLTSAEFELTKRHADEGAKIVTCLGDPAVAAIVRHHHERFDGAGYPSGLAGAQIPLGARIVAVADTFDALTSVRPYRLATPHKQAFDVLLQASGTQLDPVVVRAFLKCYSGNRAILLWALLAVTPERAAAWLRGKNAGPGNASFGTIVPTATAVTVIGAAAIATAIGAGPAPYGLRLAHAQPPLQIAAAPIPPNLRALRTAGHPSTPPGAHVAQSGRTAPRLGSTPRASAAALSSSSRRGAAGGSSHGSAGGSPRGSGGGSGGTPTGGRRGNPSGGSGAGGKPGGGHGGKPGGGSGAGGRPGGGSGSGPAGGGTGGGSGSGTAGAAGGSTPPGTGSASGSGNASGGSAGGSSGGGSGGGGGSGNGSGGGATMPVTKDQCNNGGYAQYGFTNQGQCVSFVERGSH